VSLSKNFGVISNESGNEVHDVLVNLAFHAYSPRDIFAMINLHVIVSGLFEDLKPKIPEKQHILYFSQWTDERPVLNICQCSDRRYALVKFSLEGFSLKCELMLFTKWYQCPKELTIDICDPRGFDRLCRWIFVEAIDGLRYGWNGRHNDSFRLRLHARYTSNPQPPRYHQKPLPFLEE
jgi:hypothetical protein